MWIRRNKNTLIIGCKTKLILAMHKFRYKFYTQSVFVVTYLLSHNQILMMSIVEYILIDLELVHVKVLGLSVNLTLVVWA